MINSCELFEGQLQKIHTGIAFGSIHPKLETFHAQTLRILEANEKDLTLNKTTIEVNFETGLSKQNFLIPKIQNF